jgi:hypothetical protein
MLDRVALKQMEFAGETRHQAGLKIGVKMPVEFDGPEIDPRFKQRGGQRAKPRPHFHHGVASAHPGQFEGFVNDVTINEEILPERALRKMPELGE